MNRLYILSLGAILSAILITLALAFIRRPWKANSSGTARILTIIASALGILLLTAKRIISYLPQVAVKVQPKLPPEYLEWSFLLPLVIGMVAVIIVGFPSRGPNSIDRSADLTPRTLKTFMPVPQVWGYLSVLAVTVLVAVAAGLASSRDDSGHYRYFTIDAGDMSGSTTFYGWYYSVSTMLILTVFVLLTVIAMVLISKPPLPTDVSRESAIAARRLRIRNIIYLATGAILIHLATIISWLENTAGLRLSSSPTRGSYYRTQAAFEPLTNLLPIADFIAFTAGFSLWLYVSISVMRSRKNKTPPAPQEAKVS